MSAATGKIEVGDWANVCGIMCKVALVQSGPSPVVRFDNGLAVNPSFLVWHQRWGLLVKPAFTEHVRFEPQHIPKKAEA